MSQRVEPNFFMVGAARAGTTSMYDYLRAHPQIYMPPTVVGKEPSFFCDLVPPWAAECRDLDSYLSLFEKGAGRPVIGDGSTNYLVAPESAGRIRERYPHARILIILRNPVARAHSLYRYICGWGFEDAPTFEKGLAREAERLGNPRFIREWQLLYHAFLYYHSGLYAEQVARYLDAFPRNQVHIVLFDDLKSDLLGTVQGIYRFLGVDPSFEPDLDARNESRFPLSVKFQAFVSRRWNAHPLYPRGPVRRRDKTHYPIALGINALLGGYRKERMHPDTRRRLTERFAPDIAKTAATIGRSLDHWVQAKAAAPASGAKVAVQV
ncbi:MAG TPA: sulfotransferase [Vicinamibacterales bacterium]|nr:sulfotransferase [Vicinamibacterales bacterium]